MAKHNLPLLYLSQNLKSVNSPQRTNTLFILKYSSRSMMTSTVNYKAKQGDSVTSIAAVVSPPTCQQILNRPSAVSLENTRAAVLFDSLLSAAFT